MRNAVPGIWNKLRIPTALIYEAEERNAARQMREGSKSARDVIPGWSLGRRTKRKVVNNNNEEEATRNKMDAGEGDAGETSGPAGSSSRLRASTSASLNASAPSSAAGGMSEGSSNRLTKTPSTSSNSQKNKRKKRVVKSDLNWLEKARKA